MANVTTVTPFSLTQQGLELLNKGCELVFTDVVIGDGYLEEGQSPLGLTDVIHEIPSRKSTESGDAPTADLTRTYLETEDDGPMAMISVVVTNGNNADTKLREFGIKALDPDKGKILFGYCNEGEKDALPFSPYDNKKHIAYDRDFPTYIRSTENITVTPTFIAGTPFDQFKQHTDNTNNPHNVTAEQLFNNATVLKGITAPVIPAAEKGAANGVATLDSNGLIPERQIPGSISSTVEGYFKPEDMAAYKAETGNLTRLYADSSYTAVITGESSKLYVDRNTNNSFRWSGSIYVEVSRSLTLGETSETAFPGDKGKEAHDHATTQGNPHNTSKADVGLGKVPNVETNNQTPTYSEADELANLTPGEILATAFGKIARAVRTLIAHIANRENPHVVTKSQVGLGNVNNTSDMDKPISTAMLNALNGKSSTGHSHTKAQIGLGNVDNTSDMNKPISTAVKNALTPLQEAVKPVTLGTKLDLVSADGRGSFYHYTLAGWTEGESHILTNVNTTFGGATFGKSYGLPNPAYGASTEIYVYLYIQNGVVMWDEWYNGYDADYGGDTMFNIGAYTNGYDAGNEGFTCHYVNDSASAEETYTIREAIIELAREIRKFHTLT